MLQSTMPHVLLKIKAVGEVLTLHERSYRKTFQRTVKLGFISRCYSVRSSDVGREEQREDLGLKMLINLVFFLSRAYIQAKTPKMTQT